YSSVLPSAGHIAVIASSSVTTQPPPPDRQQRPQHGFVRRGLMTRVADLDLNIDGAEAATLLQGLVRIPSYTTQETPLAEFIYEYMLSIGLDCQLEAVPLSGGKTSHNVVGKIAGRSGGPTLLFTGHMDHAPAVGKDFDDLSKW